MLIARVVSFWINHSYLFPLVTAVSACAAFFTFMIPLNTIMYLAMHIYVYIYLVMGFEFQAKTILPAKYMNYHGSRCLSSIDINLDLTCKQTDFWSTCPALPALSDWPLQRSKPHNSHCIHQANGNTTATHQALATVGPCSFNPVWFDVMDLTLLHLIRSPHLCYIISNSMYLRARISQTPNFG